MTLTTLTPGGGLSGCIVFTSWGTPARLGCFAVEALRFPAGWQGREAAEPERRKLTRERPRGEPSLAVFRGVVFKGKRKPGKSWRRGQLRSGR